MIIYSTKRPQVMNALNWIVLNIFFRLSLVFIMLIFMGFLQQFGLLKNTFYTSLFNLSTNNVHRSRQENSVILLKVINISTRSYFMYIA